MRRPLEVPPSSLNTAQLPPKYGDQVPASQDARVHPMSAAPTNQVILRVAQWEREADGDASMLSKARCFGKAEKSRVVFAHDRRNGVPCGQWSA